MPTFDIVVTTIFEPTWLEGYLENIRAHGHEHEVTIRIICDRRSPPSVYAAADAARRAGFAVDCPDLDEQETYLHRLGLPADFVPWNSDNRRNIGYLRAWEHGADVLISIDDDNFCRSDSDFVGAHAVVAGARDPDEPSPVPVGGGPWFNLCELLVGDTPGPVWPRGFPYSARGDDGRAAASRASAMPASEGRDPRRTAVNAGLWLADPDVDAVTRLAQRPWFDAARPGDVVLQPGTWSPINTQNTALVRDAVPAYYYVRMGFPVKGMVIDRFGDIWSGYFLQRIAEHLGDAVRIGAPVADHRRTTHNLFDDLLHELPGIVLTEDLLPWLRELPLSAGSYGEAYAEIADALAAQAGRFQGFLWDDGGREFLELTAGHMRTWLSAIRTLAGA